MSHGSCIITGCEFLDVVNKRWIHGDLHQLVDILIFNAKGCGWLDCVDSPLDPEAKMVRCEVYFEKNEMLVFPLAMSAFNDVAHKYLIDTIRKEEKQIITFGKGH